MPRGPKGEKRPADVIGNAVHIMRIATGEIEDKPKSGRQRSGKAGGSARAKSLSADKRREIAKRPQKSAGVSLLGLPQAGAGLHIADLASCREARGPLVHCFFGSCPPVFLPVLSCFLSIAFFLAITRSYIVFLQIFAL
jgi:hypothetical protein